MQLTVSLSHTHTRSLIIQTGFYSDHHFHYGYHIYAAAAVAHFDRDWGRVHFEDVLLLIRDIANPSSDDKFFPRFRHKDWYKGSSWASGVLLPTFANGMNQESSSEAIAAYEAVALFGQEMVSSSSCPGPGMSRLVGSNPCRFVSIDDRLEACEGFNKDGGFQKHSGCWHCVGCH